MYTYPPIAYQLIAIVSFLLPLTTSYWVVTVSFWAIFSFFFTRFLTTYLELEEDLVWVIYALIFSHIGLLYTIFLYGQSTTVVGLGFGFITVYLLTRALKTRTWIDFGMFSLAYTLTAFSHHFSFLITSLMLPFILFSHLDFMDTDLIKKIGVATGSAASLTMLGISPFIAWYLIGGSAPDHMIPHFTRTPLWDRDMGQIYATILYMYGLSLTMLVSPLLSEFRKKDLFHYRVIYSLAIFLLILGLGFTTPLPQILFPGLAHWLTYGRFTLVAALIFTGFLGIYLHRKISSNLPEHLHQRVLIAVISAIVLLNVATVIKVGTFDSSHPERSDSTDYIVNALENRSNSYRYQTFGYGPPIAEVYLNTDQPTLETWYFSSRQRNWIKEEGVDAIDSSDKEFVEKFLSHATNESVKYIFTASPYPNFRARTAPPYHSLIEQAGWEKIDEEYFGERKIVMWENPESVPQLNSRNEERSVQNYLWGTVPLLTLAALLLLSGYRREYR